MAQALERSHSNNDRAIGLDLELGHKLLSLPVGLARPGGEGQAEGAWAAPDVQGPDLPAIIDALLAPAGR